MVHCLRVTGSYWSTVVLPVAWVFSGWAIPFLWMCCRYLWIVALIFMCCFLVAGSSGGALDFAGS